MTITVNLDFGKREIENFQELVSYAFGIGILGVVDA